MKNLYIIRGIKLNQTASAADIGMNNILKMGRYTSVKSAMRYLNFDMVEKQAWKNGFDRISLNDDDGVILTSYPNSILNPKD